MCCPSLSLTALKTSVNDEDNKDNDSDDEGTLAK